MKRHLYTSLLLLTLAILACSDFLPTPATPPLTVAPQATATPVVSAPTHIPITTSIAPTSPATTIIPSSTPAPSPTLGIGATRTSSKDDMVMLIIPAGEFKMGTTPLESTILNEKPQRVVFVDEFWIDKTEISNALYALCVKDNVCPRPVLTQSATRPKYYGSLDFNNYPVIGLTWEDAKRYCEWAGRRLPTEAEWEKAARGSTGFTYPWGNSDPVPSFVNYGQQFRDTTEVNAHPKDVSVYGVLGLTGNVSEWVSDWYDPKYYESSPAKNPKGPDSGQMRGVRGGAWDFPSVGLRSAQRSGANPLTRAFNVGMRCVMSATP